MQLKFQISQIPQGNSLCTKRKARVINKIFLMRKRKFTTKRSPCIQKKSEKSTLCLFVKINHTNLVSWSCGKNELTIRIERKAVHFSSVSINWVAWFGSIVWTSIPDHEFLIISNRPKEGLMEQMPGDILHYCRVPCEDGLRIHNFPFLWNSTYVPQADGLKWEKWAII